MQSRRSFLASVLALAAAPQILVSPEMKWCRRKESGLYVTMLNPDWIAAPYEIAFITQEQAWLGKVSKETQRISNKNTSPIVLNRFRRDPMGNLVSIPKYVKVPQHTLKIF